MNNIIIQALQIMLFGMLGIFVVMGLIILVITLLQKFAGRKKKEEPSEGSERPAP